MGLHYGLVGVPVTFPLVACCIAGFTGLRIVLDLSEDGRGKCGVCAHCGKKDVQNGCNSWVFLYSPNKTITRARPLFFFGLHNNLISAPRRAAPPPDPAIHRLAASSSTLLSNTYRRGLGAVRKRFPNNCVRACLRVCVCMHAGAECLRTCVCRRVAWTCVCPRRISGAS